MMGHTSDEISQIVEISKEDALYHLRILQAGRLVYKRGKVYHINREGIRLMNMFGITEDFVRKCMKEVDEEMEREKHAKHI